MKANNFIKQPKNGRKIVSCVIACLFAFCAFLVPFSAFKPVSADAVQQHKLAWTRLPPGREARFNTYVEGQPYSVVIDSQWTYFDVDYIDSYNFYYRVNDRGLLETSTNDSTIAARIGITNKVNGLFNYYEQYRIVNEFQYEYKYGYLTANQLEYMRSYPFFISLTVNSGSSPYMADVRRTYIYAYLDDQGVLKSDSLILESTGTYFELMPLSSFPSYAFVNGGLYIEQVYIEMYVDSSAPLGTPFFVELYSRSDREMVYDYARAQQLYGSFIAENTNGVEDIFSSMWRGIMSFFETEFLPGFKLWYFLLLGLGVIVTGFLIRVFLQG